MVRDQTGGPTPCQNGEQHNDRQRPAIPNQMLGRQDDHKAGDDWRKDNPRRLIIDNGPAPQKRKQDAARPQGLPNRPGHIPVEVP